MTGRMQGEGDRESARRYRKDVEEHREDHDVDDEARRAAPKSPEQREELEKAEKKGRKRAREEDPAIERDYEEPAGD